MHNILWTSNRNVAMYSFASLLFDISVGPPSDKVHWFRARRHVHCGIFSAGLIPIRGIDGEVQTLIQSMYLNILICVFECLF